MRKILRNWRTEILALIGLFVIAGCVSVYILDHQRLRFPLFEAKPFKLKASFSTAQAVTPGQGQTVRVSGIRVGDIAKTELHDGRAIITMDLDDRYSNLVHTDATALLRPKTGLKDMFIELNPGTKSAPLAKEGWTLPIANTLPDVNPDEFLSSLDADTRDYLKLLLNGAGRGLKGRSDDLREVLRRFEPTYRDLAKVSTEVSGRHKDLRRLVNSLQRLNGELAGKDDELSELISASSKVFRVLASEQKNVSATVHNLPAALRETRDGLTKVEAMATELAPAAERLRPVAKSLRKANDALTPLAKEAAPQLRTSVRPFVRSASPLLDDLRPATKRFVRAEPDLTKSFTVLNHLFNMLGYNPGGRESQQSNPKRDEGYLFALAWLGHQSTAMFANADAHGPQRQITLGGTCGTFINSARSVPGAEFLLGLTGVLTDPRVCGKQEGT